MDASLSQALSAYKNQLNLMNKAKADMGGDDAPAASAAASGPSFSDVLGDTLSGAVGTQYKAEHAQLQSLSGKGELTDLVTAVTNAELTLDTIIAVRDKVITAYQSIISMPI